MSVIRAAIFFPMRSPVSTIICASSSASSLVFHKRAGTGFDVEDQRVDSLGQLFAHDAGADQRAAFNCGQLSRNAHISVEQFRRLADKRIRNAEAHRRIG